MNEQEYGQEPEANAETNATEELRRELAEIRQKNDLLLSKLEKLTEPKAQPSAPQMSESEFKEMLDKSPEKAFEYALKKGIDLKAREIEHNLSVKQQATYYDQKSEQDFPLLNKDKKFTEAVKQEIQSLVESGMDKNSPRLVYKAAQIAALKFKGAESTKLQKEAEPSGEAPNNVKRDSGSGKNLPKNFDRMAKMFNMSDKAKELAKQAFEIKAQQEDRRRGR